MGRTVTLERETLYQATSSTETMFPPMPQLMPRQQALTTVCTSVHNHQCSTQAHHKRLLLMPQERSHQMVHTLSTTLYQELMVHSHVPLDPAGQGAVSAPEENA